MNSNQCSKPISSTGQSTEDARSDPAKTVRYRNSGAIQVLLAVIINALCIFPSFLAGATASVIAAELHLDAVTLGFAISGFWLVASVAAYPMASRANRWGAVRALRVASPISFLMCVLLACGARSAGTLVIMLALAGCAPALATPAVNMVIMSSVQVRRRSTAFAVASTSPVFALMMAGIVGSALESVIGWRALFVLSGITVLLISLFVADVVEKQPGVEKHRTGVVVEPESHSATTPLRPLVVMMVGVLAGNIALGAATAFMVTAANTAGMDLDRAALAVSAGAGASIVLRLLCAEVVDRRGWDPFPLCWLMMLTGAVGFALLASTTSWTYLLGLVLVLGPGWSWISLLVHGVMCRYPHAVAPASGIVQTAYFIGGVLGPAAMGILVATSSFSAAWWTLCAADIIAALFVVFGGRRLPRFVSPRV